MRSWRVALASTLHASGGSAYRAYVRVAADETTAAQPPTDRPFELVPWKVLPVFAHGRSRPPVSHPHALPAGAPCEISTTTPSGRECQLAFQSSAPQAWEYDAEAPPRHPLRRTPMVEDLTCRCGFGCRGPARGEGVGGVAAEVRAGSVAAHGGAGVGVAGGDLHVEPLTGGARGLRTLLQPPSDRRHDLTLESFASRLGVAGVQRFGRLGGGGRVVGEHGRRRSGCAQHPYVGRVGLGSLRAVLIGVGVTISSGVPTRTRPEGIDVSVGAS